MLVGALLAMTIQTGAKESVLYVGTYTEANGSKGIYEVRLNVDSGALSPAKLVAQTTAPSYLCLSPNGKFVYAVNEYSEGEVSAFAIGGDGLRKLNSAKFEGKGPAHVSIASSGRWLFVSAYGGGTITVLAVEKDGSIGAATDGFKSTGSGPNPKRQEAPHVHFAGLVGPHLYACDLGTDLVLSFDFDAKQGRLKPATPGRAEPGGGPRHFAASRDGKRVYVSNEMGMSVSVFSRNGESGALRLIQTHPSLEDIAVQPGWTTSAIKMHPKLPFLYVSNRGHNSISVFEVQRDGSVAWRSNLELDVVEPRDFAIEPGGKWMVVAGQKSGELQSISIDSKSGMLEAQPGKTKLSKPVCVVFAL